MESLIDLSVVQKLKAVGADQDVSLPRIAVIGKQSSGKSSVVEMATGVALPRNSGLCTRCPMDVSTNPKPDIDWECEIKLLFKTDCDGKVMKSPITIPFKTLSKDQKDEMAESINTAQIALLNGSAEV